MPNTCSICKHDKRDEIDFLLIAGKSLRYIAVQFGVKSHSNIGHHHDCIAEVLRRVKQEKQMRSGETLLEDLIAIGRSQKAISKTLKKRFRHSLICISKSNSKRG